MDEKAGKELDARVLISPEAKEAADLDGIADDLEFVVDAVALLKKRSDDTDTISTALIEAALIRYRRCFATGVRHKLDFGNIAKIAPEYTQVHDFAYGQANKHIAHSVNNIEMMVTVALYDKAADGAPKFVDVGIHNLRGFENVENMILVSNLAERILKHYIQPRIKSLLEASATQAATLDKTQIERLKRPIFPINPEVSDLSNSRSKYL